MKSTHALSVVLFTVALFPAKVACADTSIIKTGRLDTCPSDWYYLFRVCFTLNLSEQLCLSAGGYLTRRLICIKDLIDMGYGNSKRQTLIQSSEDLAKKRACCASGFGKR